MVRPATVLVVDDDEDIRLLLSMAFNRHEDLLLVGCAVDGPSGLAAWRHLRPDVIVIDFRMPDMDGLELAASILAEEPDQPIVMCSANPDMKDLVSLGGLNAFVPKHEMLTVPDVCRQVLADPYSHGR